uniref:Transcription elongation factor SPT4 n=1 Tax=Melanopsichium pennsylvanicum 4 TaxID=1398559 RepID=A0A077RC12_9BASI|nr:probable SPT4-transcription elongation protein [Melanopsichium pennsylvanicum 4]
MSMQGSQDRVAECTTSNFDGMISMLRPEESWVAKWQRIEKRLPGLYAVKVVGRLPENIES